MRCLTRWVVGITGGSGYIGSSLARHFAGSFSVKLLDVKAPTQRFGRRVSFRLCDVRNLGEVEKSLKDVDLVVHTSIVQIPVINEQKRLAYEVNILGTQNVCKAVDKNRRTKGLILAGSWHTVGERGLKGVIDEEFGFRPDKVEDRARLYALMKIAQESIVRFYDEMSEKIFGIIRMGTVLGEGMPKQTAANIFIEKGLSGRPLTPYKHSMFRPMLYIDILDICEAYKNFATKVLNDKIVKNGSSLADIVNVYYPTPITIFELAEMVRDAIAKNAIGKKAPRIEVVDTGQPMLFNEEEKKLIKVNISKAQDFLDLKKLKSPSESIEEIVRNRMESGKT